MIKVDLEQGSEEWLKERLGKPTASNFAKILTSTGKISAQRDRYLRELVAERVRGSNDSGYSNEWMERGKELEGEARSLFEFCAGLSVTQTGVIYQDERRLWLASPDGLIEEFKSGVEIKCPAPHTHVEYLLGGKVPTEYFCQVQSNMLCANAEVWRFMSYCPGMKPFIMVVERNYAWTRMMEEQLESFIMDLDKLEMMIRN